MAVVDLNIGGRTFQLGCGDGQEQHLIGLAAALNSRITSLASSAEGSNDKLLLVMAALTMQDELNESGKKPAAPSPGLEGAINSQYLKQVADKINMLAGHIENLAEKLGKC